MVLARHRLTVPALAILSLATALAACGDDKARIPDAFCHGEANGVLCDDGDPCTIDDRCGQGVCLGRPALDCSHLDDGVCMVGACDPETVTCIAVQDTDGVRCDDGSLCTANDSCHAGACGGTTLDCAKDATPCHAAACDEATGTCALTALEDGAACDDGNKCTVEGVCAGGTCQERARDCAAFAGPCAHPQCDAATGECSAVPFEEGEACNDGNPCSAGETCVTGSCGGGTLLPDGDECQFDDRCRLPGICEHGACSGALKECPAPTECHVAFCDAATGTCGTDLMPDDTPCDDRDACTVGEHCTAGVCGTGTNQCFCKGRDDGTPCDDGQRCTANDMCATGACLGIPVSCAQLDDGKCLVGSCDPESGECVPMPVQLGTKCEDGLACTSEDRCVGGTCVGQTPDCSGADDACHVGICSESTGGCAPVPRPNGSACDDADACSGGDACVDGSCKGDLDVCGPCRDHAVGADCDDADPCTTGTICVLRDSALRCEGTPKSCADLTDTCNIGACDGDTGACKALPRLGTVACDDENPCTERDACSGGVCGGSSILTCGAQVAQCEPSRDDDQRSDAVQITAPGAATTVLGWIDPISETDWWAIPVQANRRLTIETKSHCGSTLDALIGLYDAQGNLLAEDDNNGAGDWSKIEDLITARDETLYLGVSAYRESGAGSYLVTFTSELPPPCRTDADCLCAEFTCITTGPDAGACLPRMPLEGEPNASPETATALAVGGEVRGTLEAPEDVDWFTLTLKKDEPVGFGTRAYCVEGLETEISIYRADGTTQIGYASGGGVGGHARIDRFTPDETGTYLVRVQSAAATVGAYVFSASSLLCANDAACACGDQVCGGSIATPGLCKPALESDGAAMTDITVGDRMHGTIGAALETDSFVITLAAGTYDVETAPYCGTTMDTMIEVYDADGLLVATDDDGGEGFFGGVYGLAVPVVSTYEIRVMGSGPILGDYLVTVRESGGN